MNQYTDELKEIINSLLDSLSRQTEAVNSLIELKEVLNQNLALNIVPEQKEVIDKISSAASDFKTSISLTENTVDKLRLCTEYSGFEYHWV